MANYPYELDMPLLWKLQDWEHAYGSEACAEVPDDGVLRASTDPSSAVSSYEMERQDDSPRHADQNVLTSRTGVGSCSGSTAARRDLSGKRSFSPYNPRYIDLWDQICCNGTVQSPSQACVLFINRALADAPSLTPDEQDWVQWQGPETSAPASSVSSREGDGEHDTAQPSDPADQAPFLWAEEYGDMWRQLAQTEHKSRAAHRVNRALVRAYISDDEHRKAITWMGFVPFPHPVEYEQMPPGKRAAVAMDYASTRNQSYYRQMWIRGQMSREKIKTTSRCLGWEDAGLRCEFADEGILHFHSAAYMARIMAMETVAVVGKRRSSSSTLSGCGDDETSAVAELQEQERRVMECSLEAQRLHEELFALAGHVVSCRVGEEVGVSEIVTRLRHEHTPVEQHPSSASSPPLERPSSCDAEGLLLPELAHRPSGLPSLAVEARWHEPVSTGPESAWQDKHGNGRDDDDRRQHLYRHPATHGSRSKARVRQYSEGLATEVVQASHGVS